MKEELITDRLKLRAFRPEDWKALYEYLSDERVVEYEPYGVLSEEDCKQEAIRRAGDTAFIAVCLKDTDQVIGNIYFKEQEYGTWELGYVFNYNYQKQGYATEGTRAVLEHAFLEGKARRVIAMCNPNNKNSWSLLDRLHMRREGHLKQNIYFKVDQEGKPIWQDTYEYGILAEEWR